MKTYRQVLFALLLSALALSPAMAQEFTGAWSLNANGFKGVMHLKQQGAEVTGWLSLTGKNALEDTISGTVRGNEVSFTRSNAQLAQPQQWRGFILAHNDPSIDASVRATGPDTMAGIGNHLGSWNFGWWATRIGPYRESPAAVPVSSSSGCVWSETENGWSGQWTQRGGSNIFDAVWRNGGATVTGVLTIKVTGSKARIDRRDANGLVVEYNGTIGVDGATVTGTGRIIGAVPAGAPTGPFPFQAKILCR